MATFNKTVGQATLRLNVSISGHTGNNNNVTWSLQLLCSNGLSFNNDPTTWSVNIGGHGHSGTYTFDFRSSTSKTIASGTESLPANSAGNLTFSSSGTTGNTGTSAIGGPATVSGSVTAPRIPKVPGAPGLRVTANAALAVSLGITAPSDNGGSAITSYLTQYSFNGGAFTGNQTISSGATSTYTNLLPGSYVFRCRAHNAVGDGPFTTIAAVTVNGGGHIKINGDMVPLIPHIKIGGVMKPITPRIKISGSQRPIL